MKSVKLLCNSVLVLLIAGLSVSSVVAQTIRKEQVEKIYDISPSGSLVLSSHNTNIEILTWDRNEVKITGEITYEGNGYDDNIEKYFNAFKNKSAEISNDVLELNTNLVVSAYARKKGLFRGHYIILVLWNGDEILSLDTHRNKIKTAYTIWIPETLAINVNSRYGKLNMASVKGNVDITLSNNDMVMGNFGETGVFDIRYSTVTIGSGGASRFNVINSRINVAELKNVTIDARYSRLNIAKADDATVRSSNDTFDFGTIKNINIDSRYSKFDVTTANNATIKSSNDTFIFGKLNDIDADARYSTIRIENNAGKSKFDFNNTKVFGKNFQTMEITARYSNFDIADVSDARINSSNNSNFIFATVNNFICQDSRYNTFRFGEIVDEASFPNASNTTVRIINTSASFTGFSGNFRYGTIDLKVNPSVGYNLNYDGTSGRIDHLPADRFKTRFISEKSGSRTTIQGSTAADAKCNIVIVANNVTCKIE